jgi:hypothetical protein
VGRPSGPAKLGTETLRAPVIVVASAAGQSHSPPGFKESLAPTPKPKKGVINMGLSDQQREQVRQEELVRLQFRKEMKLKRRPRLILWAALWVGILTLLSYARPLLHF